MRVFTLVFKSLDFLNNVTEDKTAFLILSSKFLNEWDLQEDNNESIYNSALVL